MAKPQVLVLIQSCQRDRANGRQSASADTWIEKWGMVPGWDYRYEIGGTPLRTNTNELYTGPEDGYWQTPHKTQAGIRWALDQGYEHVFHCAVDTYVVVPRLLATDFQSAPYVGYCVDAGVASGGHGYWLNRHAMRRIATARPFDAAEDLWVGMVLGGYGIKVADDRRYRGEPPADWGDGTISVHAGRATGTFEPDWMKQVHRQYLDWEHEQGPGG